MWLKNGEITPQGMRTGKLSIQQIEKKIDQLHEKRRTLRMVIKDISSEKSKKVLRDQVDDYTNIIAQLRKELRDRS
jgi:predicted site-specific integrase-resolvase